MALDLPSIIQARHAIIRALRQWFYDHGFIEVQAPCTSSEIIPEATIEPYVLEGVTPTRYLLPSPELHLKPLLGLGIDSFFYMGPAFRREEIGHLHNPEFTILEWYRADSNYLTLITDCQGLLSSAYQALVDQGLFTPNLDLTPPFETLTVEEIFTELAGWNPIDIQDERRFEEDLITKIEPALPEGRPLFLKDYPWWAASLARLSPSNPRVAERLELYLNRIELANGFSELVDPEEQRARFKIENHKRKKSGLPPLEIPENFLACLDRCPEAAGMALGVDRLVMILTNSNHIQEVLPLLRC